MTKWGTWYWRVFNVSVRALGLVALWSGAVFIGWGTVRMVRMDFIQLDDAPRLTVLLVGLLVAALGWAILRAPTYRPDLGDVLVRFEPIGMKRKAPPKRSWWTGDKAARSH